MSPPTQTTVTYLDNLVSRGFTDRHFCGEGTAEHPRVHHFGRGKSDGYSQSITIADHRKRPGCTGNNIVVRNRLAFLDESSADFLEACASASNADTEIPDEKWWEWIREADLLFPHAETGRKHIFSEQEPKSPAPANLKQVRVSSASPSGINANGDGENCSIPTKPGLYVAMPISTEHVPITLDSRHTHTCARVNNSHVKFGRAVSLLGRFRYGYSKDFPGNIRFIPLVSLDAADLVRAEAAVKAQLERFRIRGPKGCRLEWMQGVDHETVAQIVIHTLARESIPATPCLR